MNSSKEQLAKEQNRKYRTLVKHGELRVREAASSEGSHSQKVVDLFKSFQSNVDKSVIKGFIHRNKAARIKAKLSAFLNNKSK